MNAPGAWTDLGDGIRVRQSRAFQMNSVLLADREHTVVVDPGILPSEMEDLARAVKSIGAGEVTLFLTHAHWDHVLGRPWFPKATTLAHDRFADEVRRERAGILTDIENLAREHGEEWTRGFEPFAPDLAVSGLKYLPLGPWRLVLRDAPGHSSSQLTAHLADRSLLIAADMLSDMEPPMLDGPCAPYHATLEALVVLAENGAIETLIPGHGSILEGGDEVLERFRSDLDYLTTLEQGVREAVRRGQSLEAAQHSLATMDYTAKRSAPDWVVPIHKENIRFAYEGVIPPRR